MQVVMKHPHKVQGKENPQVVLLASWIAPSLGGATFQLWIPGLMCLAGVAQQQQALSRNLMSLLPFFLPSPCH